MLLMSGVRMDLLGITGASLGMAVALTGLEPAKRPKTTLRKTG